MKLKLIQTLIHDSDEAQAGPAWLVAPHTKRGILSAAPLRVCMCICIQCGSGVAVVYTTVV